MVQPKLGTVLLHLYAAVLAHRLGSGEVMKPIPALYIPVPSPFPVLEDFIHEATKAYNLDLFLCRGDQAETATAFTPINGREGTLPAPPNGKPKGGNSMKAALEAYKTRFPHIQGILIGTRRTDPHGGKRHVKVSYPTVSSRNSS